jgi:methionyl-tRNA formyltransferase
LPKSVLDAPRLACLNLHASLLPRWRGAAPIQAAIEAGDRATGVTVMYMAEGLAAVRAPRVPQDNALANYAPKLSRENGLIDWRATPAEIDRRIRAMNPWPAAHTFLSTPAGRRQLKLFASALRNDAAGSPGEVLCADDHGLLVAAVDGAVLLSDIQLEGKRRMSAGEFLRGHPIAPGTMLG